MLRTVAAHIFVVMDRSLTLGNGHPAKLSIVGVNGRLLAGPPANRHHLEELVAIQQVASVYVVAKKDVGLERVGGKPHGIHELPHWLLRNDPGFEGFQSLDQIFYRAAQRMSHAASSIDPPKTRNKSANALGLSLREKGGGNPLFPDSLQCRNVVQPAKRDN